MSEQDIGQDVRALIADQIDSVVQLEVLLLLHADPARSWQAADIARELRIEVNSAGDQLDLLCARGLLQSDDASPRNYRYGPRTPALERAVPALARAYAERRVTVINLIYSKPADALRSFADAFRIRKEETNG